MKVLLTGAAGFVGSHVHSLLLERGHSVVAVDLARGVHDAEWRTGDLGTLDFPSLPGDIEAVCHVAAAIAMGPTMSDQEACIRSNVMGTNRLIAWSIAAGIRTFVSTSSAGMYPRPRDGVVRHEDDPLAMPNAYLTSKWLNELALRSPEASGAMACCALRLASPYGAGGNPRAVLPIFVSKALRGERIEIQGTGSRSQDFVSVQDVARAHVSAVERRAQSGFEVMNLGSGFETSMNDLAAAVTAVFGETEIVHTPVEHEISDRFVLDVSRLRQNLAVEPVDVLTGLQVQADAMRRRFGY